MSRSTNLFANQPWKILLISSSSKIKYSNGFIIIKNSNEIKVPLSNIAVIVFEDNKSLISSVLLSKLIENNIRLIFINGKHQPIGEVCGYNLKSNNLDKITLQFNWGE
jgi:CRISPR-associated protein Cas1